MLEPGNHGSQANNILAHLLEGHSITPLDALQQYGCFRLAPVIHVLRKQGYRISTETVSNKRNGKKFASYKLEKNSPMQ
jgi:hypothetical protein|tara:strand:- start:1523 stop:1759 length:237 start_codon:yes stop_codon:yes gene_type:complete